MKFHALMSWRRGVIFTLMLVFIVGCSQDVESTADSLSKTVGDQVGNIRDKDNKYVLSVKNGYPQNKPDLLYGETFEKFFGNPTWTYFKAETGEDVVEFTGYMIYEETKVKARMQFIVHKETFEVGALSFNDVPQNEFIKNAVLNKVFE